MEKLLSFEDYKKNEEKFKELLLFTSVEDKELVKKNTEELAEKMDELENFLKYIPFEKASRLVTNIITLAENYMEVIQNKEVYNIFHDSCVLYEILMKKALKR